MNCIALKHTKFFFYYWTPLSAGLDAIPRDQYAMGCYVVYDVSNPAREAKTMFLKSLRVVQFSL